MIVAMRTYYWPGTVPNVLPEINNWIILESYEASTIYNSIL